VRFELIAAEKATTSVRKLCRWLCVSVPGFYAWQSRGEGLHARRDRLLGVLIRSSYEASRRTYGSPRVHADLVDQGIRVSRKRIARLMRAEGLKARPRKRFKYSTMSDHDQPVAANLLERQFTATVPNERWVGDASEFVVGEGGRMYLVAILDLFSRFVVGWAMGASNDRHLAIKALEMALKRRRPGTGLLHHTDQGAPYASEDYRALLEQHGITCSMSRRGDCHDNAVAESLFSTIKFEIGERFESFADAREKLFDYIEVFYNRQRRHSTIGQISPAH
jgi:putative transposase